MTPASQEALAAFKARCAELEQLLPPTASDAAHVSSSQARRGAPTAETPRAASQTEAERRSGGEASSSSLGRGLDVGVDRAGGALAPRFALGQAFGLADCAYPALLFYAELLLPVLEAALARGVASGSAGEEARGGAGAAASASRGEAAAGGAGGGMRAVYAAHPKLAAWRAGLWGHAHVQALLAELEPAGREWLEGKLRS